MVSIDINIKDLIMLYDSGSIEKELFLSKVKEFGVDALADYLAEQGSSDDDSDDVDYESDDLDIDVDDDSSDSDLDDEDVHLG